jgi:hypothetical protein
MAAPNPARGMVVRKRRTSRFTLVNLTTLGFILAWLAYDWWAITYLVSH